MDQLKAQLLLFANDLVLLADSETGMQDSMNKLDEYCKLWELEINAEKTKVVVFGKTRNPSAFKIGSKTIHCDTSYKYLGIILTANGSFKSAILTLANQANKTLFALMRGASKLFFPKPSLLCHLFDSLVRPVTEYGSETWGYTQAEQLEIIHRKFCKFALGVPRSATNLASYGELGRCPL